MKWPSFCNIDVRFVTLDGDVVNSGGSMTGGALKKNSSSLLSRKSELDDLKERLADMEIKTSKLEELVKQLKNDLAVKELRSREFTQEWRIFTI